MENMHADIKAEGVNINHNANRLFEDPNAGENQCVLNNGTPFPSKVTNNLSFPYHQVSERWMVEIQTEISITDGMLFDLKSNSQS